VRGRQTHGVPGLARQYSNSVPILLLPPSEGKAAGGSSRPWEPDSGTFSTLADRRVELAEALGAIGGGSEKLLGVTGDHLDRALAANVSLVGAQSLPAWRRYTGVVWDHLDPATLAAPERRRIVVVSGLLGLVRGDDPVPDYRLKMGSNLAPFGKLSTWWRDELSATLNRYATGRTAKQPRIIIDMLPKEHRAAWTPDERVAGVSIEFIDPTGKPGGHFAKAAKGELARAILTDGLEAVDHFRHDRFELAVTSLG
jgi:cytoplasmic iron level regulating protein YaaA (DUF328/UPF0246 family)